ncbi:hypothetical protein RUM44_010884 [Polyplax serrata]|uniref:Polyamine-modulated factor 1 n=1 Tax=Polyplax serrata TaxID=468196 RepID=A0ABR1ANG1_POLSC
MENDTSDNLKGDKNNYCQNALDMQKCLNSIVKRVLEGMTDEKFTEIYKKCYREFIKKEDVTRPALSGSSAEARSYLKQFNSMLAKAASQTIDETLEYVNHDLKELEQLKEEQAGSTVIWRPPGNVTQHMMPFEYLCETEMKKELESGIRKEQEALNLLKARLIQKRIKAEECHKKILNSISHIENLVVIRNNINNLDNI